VSKSEPVLPTRVVNPLGMRVLVRLLPNDERSKGGLYLPATVTDQATDALYGEVLAVARATPEDKDSIEGANISGIPDGARVLFAPQAGFRVPWDDSLRLVDTKDVLAVVEEFDRAETN
jgi:chaperonin GroES